MNHADHLADQSYAEYLRALEEDPELAERIRREWLQKPEAVRFMHRAEIPLPYTVPAYDWEGARLVITSGASPAKARWWHWFRAIRLDTFYMVDSTTIHFNMLYWWRHLAWWRRKLKKGD